MDLIVTPGREVHLIGPRPFAKNIKYVSGQGIGVPKKDCGPVKTQMPKGGPVKTQINSKGCPPKTFHNIGLI